jgi:prepilin-type N-terminal cleavage/methylation domain-containing protein/prepilin-type processing-associated H-X9-DG protein
MACWTYTSVFVHFWHQGAEDIQVMSQPLSVGRRHGHGRRSHIGFTLVELLVVIGIIAVLIGILLPSLSKAREQSRTVACLSNLRQIAMANYMYAGDHEGCTVPAGWRSGNNPWGDAEGYATILIAGGYLTAPNSKGSKIGVIHQNVFYCPNGDPSLQVTVSDTAPILPDHRDSGLGAGYKRVSSAGDSANGVKPLIANFQVDVWYGINAQTSANDQDSAPSLREPLDPSSKFPSTQNLHMRKMSQVRRAAETVFMYDGVYENVFSYPNRVNARHNRLTVTNMSFFDGHAQSFQTKDLPGGMRITPATDTSVFKLSNLNKNYPPPNPKWRIDQDF